jgi:lambda family phage tail tape measure protein
MAKQIEDIVVRLGLEKFEGLDKIRSSFRDLSKVTKMSEQDIIGARDSIFEFAKTAGNSEAVTKGLVSALQGLRSQADMCGDAYEELRRDIENVEAASRGYTAQAVAQRASLSAQYGAITNNTEALRRQRTALIELQQATRGGSQLFTQLSTDIQRTTTRLEEIEGIQRRTNATLNRGLPSSSAKIRRDLQDVRDRISLEQAELERLQTLTAAERRQFSQGTELRGQSGVTRAIAEQERILATFRQQAGALDLSENVRQRREAVRDANALFMSPEFTGTGSRTAEGLTRSFGDLPNTLAGINQGLSELRNRLDNTTIGTTAFTDATIRAAAAQRELREATQGVAAAFVQQLRTGDIAPSLTNLREVISSVRTEQGLLDTSSTGGARAFQLLERQARSLERQLSALQATQARLAATPVSGFREFSQSITPQEGDAAVQGSIRRNRERQERERRRLESEAADFYSSQPTVPLLLPAAGQTSAPDTGLEISGGANVRAGRRRSVTDVGGNIPVMGVRPGSGVQRFFGSADVEAAALYPGAVPIGPRATSRQEGENRSAVIAEKDARLANSAAIEEQRKRMESLRAAVDKATKANTGSINSLGNLREALANLRNEIPETNGEFKQLTNRLQDVDVRSERLSTRASRRLSGVQLAQGVGAALSGGIFGGPEGLIGGLGGLALGGVGGAFAGAAAGAQVGMFRQQLGTVTDYSARIDKLQIALRGIVGSQDAYSQALAAAASVTRDLNIPQEVAIQGMTRLSAAVKGAGGTVSDSAFAFRAVSEAVKATGGNAEQADGALLALTQVFSKGKVSAEELNQIAERLPGTFTLFAKAAGMTGPQLQKALQEGQVGLNDLMKFLQLISTEYGQTALKIADSSQEAGARLSVAMKNMQLEVGRALQPIGASLQSAFADFITKITPSVVSAMKGIAAAFEFLIENKTASGLATFALQLGAVTAGLIALRSAMATLAAVNLAAMFTTTAASAKITGDVLTTTAANAGGLTTKLAGLRGAVSALALSFAKPIILTVGIAGVVVVIDYLNKLNAAKDRLQRASTASRGENWLQEIGGSATDVATLRKQVQAAGDTYQYLADKIKQAKAEQATTPFKPRKEFLQKQIDADMADLAVAQSRYRAGINALAQRPAATSGLSTFPTPATDEEKKKKLAADKAARDAQAAAAEQQRLANTLLDQQLNAADRLFQHQIELDRQRYELQKRLDDAQAQNRIMRETGAARDIVSNFEDLQRSLREIEERRVRAVQDVRLAKQTQQSAAVRATFDAQGAAMLRGTTGVIARTGSTGQSTGPHLDARWADGRRITAAEADRYLSVNGRAPSSYGVTSPYGPRSLFGRNFHAGIDFGTPSGSGITLKNGATLLRDLGFTGAGGYAVEINTKDGPMRLLHLQRGSARMPTGAAAQQNRAIRASGGAVIEGLDVNQAAAQQQLIETNAPKERAALFEQFTLRATDALKQQNKELSDSNALQTLRNRLTLEGVSPALIELEERLLGNRQKQNEAQAKYNTLIANEKDPATRAELTNSLAQQNEFYTEQARLLRDAAAAKETFDKAMRTRQDERIGLGLREGAEAYVQSIGTMREATAQLAQTGIKGVEDAIFSLTTTGKANFQEFAKSVLESTSRMIIQQLILRSVMQIIGAIGGGSSGGFSFSGAGPVSGASVFGSTQAGFNPLAFSGIKLNALGNAYAANGIVPFAMGGVVEQPTMFKFADGGAGRLGLMGEAEPEAIMPLRRLPNGRLGVEQAGGGAPVTVNVSVDATGTSVQGNAGQGEQLGRVISQAVQAELVRQQRPGGLLSR